MMRYCFMKMGDVVGEWQALKTGRSDMLSDSLVPKLQELVEIAGDQPMLVLALGPTDREFTENCHRFVTIKNGGNSRLVFWKNHFVALRRAWRHMRRFRPDLTVVLGPDLRLWLAAQYHRRYGGRVLPALEGAPMAEDARGSAKLVGKIALRTMSREDIPVILSIGPGPGRMVEQMMRTEKQIQVYWPIFPRHLVETREQTKFHGDDRFRVFFVGRVTLGKGIFTFIRIISELAREIAHLHAVVIGEGPDRRDAERLCKELGLQTVVDFVGHKPARMMFSYFAAGHVLVVPTRGSLSEGCCRVSMEGILGGIVPVASSVGGLVDNIEDGKTGFLVPPDRIDLFVERILTLYRKPELRLQMIRNAEEKRKFFLNPPDTLVTCVRRFVEESFSSP